jgi:sucrose phosphorylase
MVIGMETVNIDPKAAARIRELLEFIYEDRATEAEKLVLASMERWEATLPRRRQGLGGKDLAGKNSRGQFSEKDALLISYGDMIAADSSDPSASAVAADPVAPPTRTALGRLGSFVDRHASGLFSYLHILPFCPYSSDDGFSVMDYRVVDPALGNWEDVRALGKERKLVFDLVLNHASAKGLWFRRFLAGEKPYDKYFVTRPLDYDSRSVTRPRTHPLITPCRLDDGRTVGLWTTFSADQVDLDFSEPAVLADFVDILLEYAARGARMVRLDAIAYLWKEDGTSCIHLPQTHGVVKLFRAVVDALELDMVILTETNVPHDENMSYFGDGDEAHLVYNFSLPPLTLYAFATGDAGPLSRWAAGLKVPAGGTLLNFLASHDGVGVTPAKGLVDDVGTIIKAVQDRGGLVSYKATPEGKVPYELNISWSDAVAPVDATEDERVASLLASYAVACAMDGLPAIYFHSLAGSRSWKEGPEALGYNRAINRQRPRIGKLERTLDDPGSMSARSLAGFSSLLAERGRRPAFAPDSPRRILSDEGPVFALERGSGRDRVMVLINCSREAVNHALPEDWAKATRVTDPCADPGGGLAGGQEGKADADVSGRVVKADRAAKAVREGEDGTVVLPGYSVRWLEF